MAIAFFLNIPIISMILVFSLGIAGFIMLLVGLFTSRSFWRLFFCLLKTRILNFQTQQVVIDTTEKSNQYCSKCGKGLSSEDAFCTKCGNKIA